jgi:alkylation response protein AidB-like acyl-CoA dehydrogenase
MYPIFTYGSEDQKRKYLPKLASGEMMGCFGLTEPDFGSNPNGMLSNFKDQGNHYLLNGSKMWISNAPFADLAVVWAKDENGIIRGRVFLPLKPTANGRCGPAPPVNLFLTMCTYQKKIYCPM